MDQGKAPAKNANDREKLFRAFEYGKIEEDQAAKENGPPEERGTLGDQHVRDWIDPADPLLN